MSSSIPGVLDALYRIAQNIALTGVQAIDGQPLSVEVDYLAIGFTRDPESLAVETEGEPVDLDQASSHETYQVQCEASSWNGDPVQKTARDRAFDILDAFKAAVLADTDLRDLADTVWISRGGLIQGIAGEGAVATIPFSVHVEAYTNP